MAQAGTLVVCGDAAHGLGDSLYEAVIYVRGTIEGLGTDAREEPLGPADIEKLTGLLGRANLKHDPHSFKRIASARTLYHWHLDHSQAY
jgi:methylamine---glutamate N-methyltransferase subunit B